MARPAYSQLLESIKPWSLVAPSHLPLIEFQPLFSLETFQEGMFIPQKKLVNFDGTTMGVFSKSFRIDLGSILNKDFCQL